MSKIKLNLQHFAAEAGLTKAQNIQVTPRELDFVSVFSRNWEALTDIMGIMRPIQKQPGQVLKSKYAEVTLENGDIGEGEQIPYSEATVKTKDYKELNLKKYKKAVSIEAILEHGYDTAVGMTDDEFMAELQFKVMDDYYAYLKTGTLKATESNFQKALSKTQGALKNRWKEMHRTITSIVGFCNINDFYNWLGDQNIGPQIASQFGLNYLKNWMGYGTLFLCSDDEIPQGTVIATPVQNIVLYYVSPGHQDFARAGLNFVVDGITPLLGFNTIGNYNTDVSENNALMGMTLFSEYLDGIAVVTFGEDEATDSANLTAITVGDLELSPEFNPETTTYTAATTNESDKVTAKTLYTDAEVAITNGTTKVKNGGNATWTTGSNTLTLAVTNDSTTKTYTVTVTKS